MEQEISLLRITASAGLAPPFTDSQLDQVYTDFCTLHGGEYDFTKSQVRTHLSSVSDSPNTVNALRAAVMSLPNSIHSDSEEWRSIEPFLLARISLISCIRGYRCRRLSSATSQIHAADGDVKNSNVVENHWPLPVDRPWLHSLSNVSTVDNGLDGDELDAVFVPKPVISNPQSSGSNNFVINLDSDNDVPDDVQQRSAEFSRVPTKRHRRPSINRTVKSRQNSVARSASRSAQNCASPNNNCLPSCEDLSHSHAVNLRPVDIDAFVSSDPPLAEVSGNCSNVIPGQDLEEINDNRPITSGFHYSTKNAPLDLDGAGSNNNTHVQAVDEVGIPHSEKSIRADESEIELVRSISKNSQPVAQEQEVQQSKVAKLLSDIPPLTDIRPVQSPLDNEFMPINLTKSDQSNNEKLSELLRRFEESRNMQHNSHSRNDNQRDSDQCVSERIGNENNREDINCNNKQADR